MVPVLSYILFSLDLNIFALADLHHLTIGSVYLRGTIHPGPSQSEPSVLQILQEKEIALASILLSELTAKALSLSVPSHFLISRNQFYNGKLQQFKLHLL